jgi:hypothetical protein
MRPKNAPSSSAQDTVVVHPDLAEFALKTNSWREYAVYLMLIHLSPEDHGVYTCDVVKLSKRLGFRRKSTVHEILQRGRGAWWDVDTHGRWVRTGCGRRALYASFGLLVTGTPKAVPLQLFRNPRSVFLACIHPTCTWARQSRHTIARRTGMSRHAQLRTEQILSPDKRRRHADLDRHRLTQAAREQWGGVWPNPRTGRMSRQLPNEYRSPFPDAPYGRVSRSSRKCLRFRRFKGPGPRAVRREPQRRYFDDLKAGTHAKCPKGLRPDEAVGPIFVDVKGRTVCRELPVFRRTVTLGTSPGSACDPDWTTSDLEACTAVLSESFRRLELWS